MDFVDENLSKEFDLSRATDFLVRNLSFTNLYYAISVSSSGNIGIIRGIFTCAEAITYTSVLK